MKILLVGLLLISLVIIFQIIIWKIHIPKRQTLAILKIFAVTFLTGGFILYLLTPTTLIEYLHLSLLLIAFTVVYILNYPAIEADSPSLFIVLKIADKKSGGLSKDELISELTNEVLVKPRLNDLLNDKMAYLSNNKKYRLTPKGVYMAKIFLFIRNLLKINEIGG